MARTNDIPDDDDGKASQIEHFRHTLYRTLAMRDSGSQWVAYKNLLLTGTGSATSPAIGEDLDIIGPDAGEPDPNNVTPYCGGSGNRFAGTLHLAASEIGVGVFPLRRLPHRPELRPPPIPRHPRRKRQPTARHRPRPLPPQRIPPATIPRKRKSHQHLPFPEAVRIKGHPFPTPAPARRDLLG